ncbi:MAG: tRNA 2-thiocytidine(32) synthetase TtcA [Pseudomonadota bacterium]
MTTVMPSRNFEKLRKLLFRESGKAVVDYGMIQEGDKVMACLSGGADSYTMLDVLIHLKRVAPINFDIVAVNLDQKQPGFPEHVLPDYLNNLGVEYRVIEKDTYSIVKEKLNEGQKTCWLCSRMRRGILYNAAEDLGLTKIALGHHADDIVETLFLNMIHGAKLSAMPPKLISDDKRNIVIRPLAYCREKDIKKYAAAREFPIIPCNLCGSQENLQRQATKQMLQGIEREHPKAIYNMLKALTNVSPSQLADAELFDFRSLEDNVGSKSSFSFNKPLFAGESNLM